MIHIKFRNINIDMKKLNHIKNIVAAFCAIGLFFALPTSCSKDEIKGSTDSILGLGGESYPKTEVDMWLMDNYTKNYNMEVKYRFNRFELDLNKMLVPIKEEIVIPVMEVVKKVWIDPYEAVAGSKFIKTLAPKSFVLVGSPQYNNGTITLGEAEGGRKIVIFRLNWYIVNPQTQAEVLSNKDLIQSMMKTVHHEFGHTMHQITLYPVEFSNITPSGYTSSWHNVDDDEAMRLGYISAYATANPNEDFVETLSRILVYGKAAFDNRVAQATAIYNDPAQNKGMTYDPGAALRAKETIVVKYLKEVWGIEMYDPAPGVKGLETLVQEAINDLVTNAK